MRTRQFVLRTWLVPALLLVGVLSLPAAGADRVVLCEEFTNTGCGYCSYAGQALNMMLNNFPNTFTLVQIHIGDSYATPWGNARQTFYGVTGTPTAWFDGMLECVGAYTNVTQQYNWYLSKYNARRAVPTDVTITATGVQQIGQTFLIRTRICIEPGGTAKTMRIYMVQVLDHWPSSPTYHRNGFKQAAATQDITLSPGSCQTISRTFTFDAGSWADPNNIKIIVWAQVPNAAAPANVYQAHNMNWPFPGDCNANGQPDPLDISSGLAEDCNSNGVPDECDIAGSYSKDCNENNVPDECDLAEGTSEDCNDNDVPDECDIAEGTSQDNNGNGIPDECEILRGDVNCDGTVGFGDINAFVLMMTDPAAWQATYTCPFLNGDINEDGTVGFGDINPFVALLTSGTP